MPLVEYWGSDPGVISCIPGSSESSLQDYQGRGMIEELVSFQGIEASSDTSRPFTEVVFHHLG